MKNFDYIVFAAATVTALGITAASAQSTQRVLPTVNKIDFGTGERSTFSLYEGMPKAPLGISVAAGDLDGDGFGDFATVEHWGDPHENVNGVIVRGWDNTVKAQVFPADATNGPRQITVSGVLEDGNENGRFLFVGSGSDFPSARYHHWEWEDSQGRLTNLETVEPFTGQPVDSSISLALDSLATDGFGVVVGSQSLDHNGHVTILKAAGDVGGSVQVSDNTFGGGVRVAVGDVNGDGRSDICTMSIGETMGSQGTPERCIDLSVLFVDGTAGPETLNFTKIEFEYKPQKHGDLDIGVLPGGIACGDVDGDGLAELIFTTSEESGPEVKYFDFLTGDSPRFGELHEVSLDGLADFPYWNRFTILEPSFTTVPFDPLAPEGSSMGSLLLSTLVVPEPATLTLLGAIGALMLRRRA